MQKFIIRCLNCEEAFPAIYPHVDSRTDIDFDNLPSITCPCCLYVEDILPTTDKVEVKLDFINSQAYNDVLDGHSPRFINNEYYMTCYNFWESVKQKED